MVNETCQQWKSRNTAKGNTKLVHREARLWWSAGSGLYSRPETLERILTSVVFCCSHSIPSRFALLFQKRVVPEKPFMSLCHFLSLRKGRGVMRTMNKQGAWSHRCHPLSFKLLFIICVCCILNKHSLSYPTWSQCVCGFPVQADHSFILIWGLHITVLCGHLF